MLSMMATQGWPSCLVLFQIQIQFFEPVTNHITATQLVQPGPQVTPIARCRVMQLCSGQKDSAAGAANRMCTILSDLEVDQKCMFLYNKLSNLTLSPLIVRIVTF